MSFKRWKKFKKKALKFEKEHTRNLWRGIKDDPKRLVLGVDPFSTKMWNKALGRDDRALVNQLGGATSYDYQVALEKGIDIGPGKAMHDVAGAVAGAYAGGALGQAAGAGAGAVPGVTVGPATQTAITTGTRMAVPAATAALEDPIEVEEESIGLGGLGSLRVHNVPTYRRAEGGRVPSKSPAQAKLMRAVAHGWNKPGGGGPSRAVAQEFVDADRKYSGGFAENRYWTGGLAAMNEVNSGVPETLNWQEGGDVDLSPRRVDMGDFRDILSIGAAVANGWRFDKEEGMLYPPASTLAAGGEDPAVGLAALTPEIRGENVEPWMPRVIPGTAGTSEPVQQTFAPTQIQSPEERAEQTALARQSSYRDQLREHKSRVAAALKPASAARGGHMNYQEGGAVPEAPQDIRPGLGGAMVGHAEGPNPYTKHIKTHPQMYEEWERRNHRDPAPPAPIDGEVEPAIILPEAEEAGSAMDWLKDMLGVGDDSGLHRRSQRELEAQGIQEPAAEARGGHVRGYQMGGLARVAPPLGGVPPWIEPEGYVEPEGYQAGGAARWSPQQQQAWRGRQQQVARAQPQGGGGRWSPQQQAAWRGRQQMQQQRALPQQGADRMAGMMADYQQGQAAQRGAAQPTGGLAAMQQRAQADFDAQRALPQQLAGRMAGMQGDYQAGQQALAQRGAAPPAGGMAGRVRQMLQQQQQRAGAAGPQPGGFMGRVRQMADAQRQQQGLTGPWQGDPANNPMRPRGPLAPGGSPLQLPGRRPPPWMPRVIDGEGGIPGGPRVPPNMRGFLQKQRMMNRPPPNVGGGVNRVGQQDQQGAQARAMQRGTGRRPMSRRGGFPGRRGVR